MKSIAIVLALLSGIAAAQVTLTEATNFSVHASRDARLVIDVLGALWIVPQNGGAARRIASGPYPVRRPRWSPGADAIIYQAHAPDKDQLWLVELDGEAARPVGSSKFFDQQPDWHPDGTRIVYSSDRRDSGFDLWELDLKTGLTWRISHGAGDETEPAWSADGQDLVYIHAQDDTWSLVLRRQGQPDHALVTSGERLSAPAWRPDGSLVTFLRHADTGLEIDMAILSDPPIVRKFITGEDLFVAPVTWRGRQQLLYAANGLILQRDFNAWRSTTLPFSVTVEPDPEETRRKPQRRTLPPIESPRGMLVIRAARLFDGIGGGYQYDKDIVIENGRIVGIEERRDRPGAIVVDMGEVSALPGIIDGTARLPENAAESLGPLLLSFGVTTIVTDHDRAARLDAVWSGTDTPGPRVLGADWLPDLDTAPSLIVGARSLPASPAGKRYRDLSLGNRNAPTHILSGLADARTAGIEVLLQIRQAGLLQQYSSAPRRFTNKPQLTDLAPAIVLGSGANGLAPGLAQHAELLALSAAGLDGEQVLRAAGTHAAAALGLGWQLGRIATGSAADIVLVDGDPLADIAAMQRVVGVVRNGRFFSAIGLIERAQCGEIVE